MGFTETQAMYYFMLAIKNNQCAEFLNNLIEGGGFTFDMNTQRLIMITPPMLEEILEASEDD